MTLLQLPFQKLCHVLTVKMATAPPILYCVAVRDGERNHLSKEYNWVQCASPVFILFFRYEEKEYFTAPAFSVFKEKVLVFGTEINSANICTPLLKDSLKIRKRRYFKKSHSCLGVISLFNQCMQSAMGCPPLKQTVLRYCQGESPEGQRVTVLVITHSLHWLGIRQLPPLQRAPPKLSQKSWLEDTVSQCTSSGGTFPMHPPWPAPLT